MHNNKEVFILGAGASVHYNLPIWSDLASMIVDELKVSTDDIDIKVIRLIGLVGVGKKYDTIDDAISLEGSKECPTLDNLNNFEKVEDKIFETINRIFVKRYKECTKDWIVQLLEYKYNEEDMYSLLRDNIFINLNYDGILNKKLGDFYEKKIEEVINKRMPGSIERKKRLNPVEHVRLYPSSENMKNVVTENSVQNVIYPYGYFHNESFWHSMIKPNESTHRSNRFVERKNNETMPNNAVSCKDSVKNVGALDFARNEINQSLKNINIIGLGPDSINTNMEKIFGGIDINVENLYFTCNEKNKLDIYWECFNNLFTGTEINKKQFSNCKDFINNYTQEASL